MHEVHAALAVVALRRQLGEPVRISEDEFYALYSEAPWRRLAKLSHALFARLTWRAPAAAPQQSGACQFDCGLTKA